MTENIFTDPRDGQSYKLMEQNGLTWMVENLNFSTEDSWWYQDNEEKGKEFGQLYTWDAAIKACPPGCRLPSQEEFLSLIEHFGGLNACYKPLTEGGISKMNFQMGGYRANNGKFGRLGAWGGYWSSTDLDRDHAISISFDGYYEKVDISDTFKSSGKSCRFIKI